MPLRVCDGNERKDPDGFRTPMCRMVSTANDHVGADGTHVSIEFVDGTPGRKFDPDEIIEVHSIRPGRDLMEAFDRLAAH